MRGGGCGGHFLACFFLFIFTNQFHSLAHRCCWGEVVNFRWSKMKPKTLKYSGKQAGEIISLPTGFRVRHLQVRRAPILAKHLAIEAPKKRMVPIELLLFRFLHFSRHFSVVFFSLVHLFVCYFRIRPAWCCFGAFEVREMRVWYLSYERKHTHTHAYSHSRSDVLRSSLLFSQHKHPSRLGVGVNCLIGRINYNKSINFRF